MKTEYQALEKAKKIINHEEEPYSNRQLNQAFVKGILFCLGINFQIRSSKEVIRLYEFQRSLKKR